MGRDEIDRGGELGRLFRLARRLLGLLGIGQAEPDVVGFARGHRHRALALDAADDLDELVNSLFRAQRGLVADHQRIDVAVTLGERNGRGDLALVAFLILVDPDADGNLKSEFGGNARHEFDAAGRGIGADGARVEAELFEIGADLRLGRTIAVIGMLRACVGRVGDTRKLAADARCRMLALEQAPDSGMQARHERDHACRHLRSLTRADNGYAAVRDGTDPGRPSAQTAVLDRRHILG